MSVVLKFLLLNNRTDHLSLQIQLIKSIKFKRAYTYSLKKGMPFVFTGAGDNIFLLRYYFLFACFSPLYQSFRFSIIFSALSWSKENLQKKRLFLKGRDNRAPPPPLLLKLNVFFCWILTIISPTMFAL